MSHRVGYSRYIQRQKAVDEYNALIEEIASLNLEAKNIIPGLESLPPRLEKFPEDFETNDMYEFLRKSQEKPVQESDKKKKVCIIGGGAAGLFTGLLFDFLNRKSGLDITYDILEAADGTTRKGGRLYTHNFTSEPKGSHDYYDVGAMRFPEGAPMKRLFRLFRWLEMYAEDSDTKTQGALIPYYMHSQWRKNKDDDYKCYDPYYFNNIHKQSYQVSEAVDPFQMNETKVKQKKIDEAALKIGPSNTMQKVIMAFLNGNELLRPSEDGKTEELDYEKLLSPNSPYDQYSTRTYLQGTSHCGPGYNFYTIQWLETFEGGTGWYDQAWIETVLEYLDFNPLSTGSKNAAGSAAPGEEGNDSSSYKWWCINGGTIRFVERMEEKLVHKVKYGRTVTKISPDLSPATNGLVVTWRDAETGKLDHETYDAVFASVPLGCMRRIDTSELYTLEYETKLAIRSLTYGPSTKVGIKFKNPWWLLPKYKIGLGGVAYTDANLRMCVYPSYKLDLKEPGVLIASYAWTQDAMRLSSLISTDSPKKEELLKDLLIDELARLHSDPNIQTDYHSLKEFLHDQYLEHFAWSWYGSPDSTGAFAFFGPGQYASLYPALTQRESIERLYFIGEHTSAFHAWVQGALDSGQRAVFQFCESNGFTDAMEHLEKVPSTEEESKIYPWAPLPADYEKPCQNMRHNMLSLKIERDVGVDRGQNTPFTDPSFRKDHHLDSVETGFNSSGFESVDPNKPDAKSFEQKGFQPFDYQGFFQTGFIDVGKTQTELRVDGGTQTD